MKNKDDMTVDNDYIRDFLEMYARRNEFRLGFKAQKLQDPLVGARYYGCADNKYCNDHLNMYISIDNNKVRMNHFGDYCALAHAAAEMFCELVNNEEVEVVLSVIYGIQKQNIQNSVQPTNDKASTDINKFEILFSLMEMPMSSTRKYCISLPWRAAYHALNTK